MSLRNTISQCWERIHQRWWSRWLLNLALIAIVVGAIGAFQTRHLLPSGGDAPEFSLRRIDGTPVSTRSLRGKKLVLAFWSPWCGVCKFQTGALNALNRDPDVRVVSVVLSYRSLEEVRQYMKANKVDYPVLLGNRRVAEQFNVQSFPTLYILDTAGRVEHALVGYTTEWGLRLRLAL